MAPSDPDPRLSHPAEKWIQKHTVSLLHTLTLSKKRDSYKENVLLAFFFVINAHSSSSNEAWWPTDHTKGLLPSPLSGADLFLLLKLLSPGERCAVTGESQQPGRGHGGYCCPEWLQGCPFSPESRVLGLCPLPNCTTGTNFRASIPLWSLCLPAWNQPTGSKLLKRGWQTSRWTARQNSCVSFVSLGKQAKKRNKMQYSLIIVYKNTEINYLTLCNECNGSAELFILLEKPVSRPQRISWEAERQHNLPVTLSEKKLV